MSLDGASPESPVTTKDALKRQTIAGTVVDGVRQPELTREEAKQIMEENYSSLALSDEDRALLKKQSSAGVGGTPELTPEERNRIAQINELQDKINSRRR